MKSEIMGIIISKGICFVILGISLLSIKSSEKNGKKPSFLATVSFGLTFCITLLAW